MEQINDNNKYVHIVNKVFLNARLMTTVLILFEPKIGHIWFVFKFCDSDP